VIIIAQGHARRVRFTYLVYGTQGAGLQHIRTEYERVHLGKNCPNRRESKVVLICPFRRKKSCIDSQ
jgi:hypothetical protein